MFLLLKNAELYDPHPKGLTRLLLEVPAMNSLVTGQPGRVLAVAPDLDPAGLPGMEVMDLEGALVVPGLVDAHAHLGGGGGEGGFGSRMKAPAPEDLARSGITTAVGVLGTDGITRSLEDLYARAKALDAAGLSGWMYTGNYHLPLKTLTGDLARDLVLIDKVVGAGEVALGDHRGSQGTFEELSRLASQARTGGLLAGKAGLVHIHLGDSPKALELLLRLCRETEIPASQWFPTHLNRHRSLLEPAQTLLKMGMNFDLTAGFVDQGEELSPAACLRILKDKDADFRHLTLSSDCHGSMPVFDPEGNLIKLEAAPPDLLMKDVQACLKTGFSLEETLPLVTSNPARILKLPGSGALKPGSRADLLLVDSGFTLRRVMAGGRWFL